MSDVGSTARTFAAGALGYLAGSIPSADFATRLATRGEIDLREHGSGNPGATNAAQVLGSRWGTAVLVADVGKGVFAGFAGRRAGGDAGCYAAATAAIAGHIFPVWSGFRGGKGVATSAGAVLAAFPAYFPVDAAVAAAGVLGLRNAARVMWVNGPVWVGASLLWYRRGWPNAWGPRPSRGLVAFSAVGAAMILAKFRASGRTQG